MNDLFEVKYKIEKNTDSDFLKDFKKRLKNNGGYCPCKFEKSQDTKCPCKDFRNTQECICGLYIKVPCYE